MPSISMRFFALSTYSFLTRPSINARIAAMLTHLTCCPTCSSHGERGDVSLANL